MLESQSVRSAPGGRHVVGRGAARLAAVFIVDRDVFGIGFRCRLQHQGQTHVVALQRGGIEVGKDGFANPVMPRLDCARGSANQAAGPQHDQRLGNILFQIGGIAGMTLRNGLAGNGNYLGQGADAGGEGVHTARWSTESSVLSD